MKTRKKFDYTVEALNYVHDYARSIGCHAWFETGGAVMMWGSDDRRTFFANNLAAAVQRIDRETDTVVEDQLREYVVFTGDTTHGVYSATNGEQALLAYLHSQGYASLQEHVNDPRTRTSQNLCVRGPLPLPAHDIRVHYDQNAIVFRMGGDCQWLCLAIRQGDRIADDRYIVPTGSALNDIARRHRLSDDDVARLILVPIARHLAEPVVADDPHAPPRAYPGANVNLRDHEALVA